MKTRFFLIFCILVSTTTLFAQSGRIVQPTPTPTLTVETPKVEDAKKEFPPCESNLEEYIYISPRKIKEFTEELNFYGNCGYKLERSAKIPLNLEISEEDTYFFAVMKFDDTHKYEYQWFEAYSPGQTQTRMNLRAEQGFYFIASHSFQLLAENRSGDSVDILTNSSRSTYGNFLIFEKKVGENKKLEYRILDSEGVRERFREQNQNKLNLSLNSGFYPVGIINAGTEFAIIVEQNKQIAATGEYLILNYRFNLNKKLNELSKMGYQPIFVAPYMSLLFKDNNQPSPFNKINCFKSPERILEKPHEVSNTQFVVSGFDFLDADLKTSLCFGFPQNRKSISFEYKLHKMTNVAGRPKGSDKYNSLRQPPTAEMLAEFQNLLKQGYIIREVLASKEIYILFERPKQ